MMKGVSRISLCSFLLAALVSAVGFSLIRFERSEISSVGSVRALYEGSARVPYQYRVLPLWIARAVEGVFPNLPICRESPKVVDALNAVQIPATGLATLLLLEIGSIVVLLVVMRSMLQIFGVGGRASLFLPFMVFYPLSFHLLLSSYHRYWYPSDLPAVMFFTAGSLLILQKRLVPYLVLFTIATLNRETTIFLAVLYALIAWKEGALDWRFPALQVALWGVIKGGLFFIYSGSGGAPVHPNLIENLAMLARFEGLVALAALFGSLWVPLLLFMRFLKDKRAAAMLLLIPIYLAGMLCVGHLPEARIFSELVPLVTVLVSVALWNYLNVAPEATSSYQ